ncbi:hypothetical protein AAKU55_000788 [Oxalobacteraceae bacterium GrIS 1.11]
MIDLKRRKSFLNVRELFFADSTSVEPEGEDLQYFIQAAAPGRGGGQFLSSMVALGDDEALLLANVRKGFAYEIRRAHERDLISPIIQAAPDDQQIERFCTFFDAFAAAKSLGPANHAKLRVLARSTSLVLAASVQEGRPEHWFSAHAYICDGMRARLLYSAGNVGLDDPEQRKVLGRANKLLHWNMIQYFKQRGFGRYDFGGISKSAALKAVDDFKEGFGGRELIEYNYLLGITPLGKLCVFGFGTLEKLKAALQARKKRRHAHVP